MSDTTVIPCAVFHFPEFKAQRAWFQQTVFTLANALSEYGEGVSVPMSDSVRAQLQRIGLGRLASQQEQPAPTAGFQT